MGRLDYPEDVMASIEDIIQKNLNEQRNLTAEELKQLFNYTSQLTAYDDECFEEYKVQFCHLLNQAREKSTDQKAKIYYYALMAEFRLRNKKNKN